MYLEFKSFSYILVGVSFLGIALGVVLGAYFKSNELDYFIYISAFLAAIGSAMVIIGAFKKDD
jgi:membrane protein CcdC involved in cytochrome C biogenesis